MLVGFVGFELLSFADFGVCSGVFNWVSIILPTLFLIRCA